MIKILTDASAEAILQQVKETEGSLSDLSTAAKGNLVSAVNEVKNDAATLDERTKVFAEARTLGTACWQKNLLYRGKCLGTKPTAAQLAAIANGTFDDMYLGDYWTGAGNGGWTDLYWMIVHFNYYAHLWGGPSYSQATPHITVMQMKSATAPEARNLARIPGWESGDYIDSDNVGYQTAEADNTTGTGGYSPALIYNALTPTFGYDHLMRQWGYEHMIESSTGLPNGKMTAGGVFVRPPYFSQLTGLQVPSSDGKIHSLAYTGRTYGDRLDRLDVLQNQFAAFRARPIYLQGFGRETEHPVFWLKDIIGPNSSGTPMGLLGVNSWAGVFAPKEVTYSDANSTYHMYASIK